MELMTKEQYRQYWLQEASHDQRGATLRMADLLWRFLEERRRSLRSGRSEHRGGYQCFWRAKAVGSQPSRQPSRRSSGRASPGHDPWFRNRDRRNVTSVSAGQ